MQISCPARLAIAVAALGTLAGLLAGCTGGGPVGGSAKQATTSPPGAGGGVVKSVRAQRVADPAAALRQTGQQVAGQPLAAVGWTDTNGTNLLVLSRSGAQRNTSRSAMLYADHFVTSDGRTRLLRQVQDGTRDCQFDLQAGFVAGAPLVSDVDSDGMGEALFAYTLGCVSDVRPVALKLLVLENGRKFIVRGQTYLRRGMGAASMGRLPVGDPEPAWGQWPAPFQTQARASWDRWAIRQ